MVNFAQRFRKLKKWINRNNATIPQVNYSLNYNEDGVFPEDFYINLISTINFTEEIITNIKDREHINYELILRTTNPEYNGSSFYYYDRRGCFTAKPDIEFNYLELLQKALEIRRDKIVRNPAIFSLGQILEFDIDVTELDGAASSVSEGFTDMADIPPIDTWFFLTKTKLYCWIPSLFIEKMQNALEVSVMDAYRWLKDSNPALQELTERKLKLTEDNSSCNHYFNNEGR